MTNTYAIEKQAAIPISYGSALAAWNAAVNYTGTSMNYLGKTFDNVGWVRGTKNTAGGWGAYLWVLQNRIAFQASTTAWWTATNDISVAITNVMVGSLGDYQALEKVDTNVPPLSMATNDLPGADQSDEATYQVDYTNVFYELVIPDIWITPRFAVRCVGGSNVQYTVAGTNIPNGVRWKIIPEGLINGAVIYPSNDWHFAGVTPGDVATNYKVRATAKDNTNFYDQVNLAVVKAELKSISFVDAGAGHGGDNEHPIKQNSSDHQGWGVGAAINDPVWIADGPDADSNPDTNEPVCYTRSSSSAPSRLKIDVVMKVQPANQVFNLVAVSEGAEYFRKNRDTSSGSEQTVTMVAENHQLPISIQKIQKSFDWKVEIISGPTCNLVSSTHDIYVIYDSPLDEITPKRLEKVCVDWSSGQSTMNGTANAVQAGIQSEPPYFDGEVGRRTDIWYMMETNDPPHWNRGDCLSHAMLIQEGLETVGIGSTVGRVYASRDDGNAWEQLDHHPDHTDWDLRIVNTPGYNNWEGVAKLEVNGTWYYYGGVPDVDGNHSTDAGASIMLLRAYVTHYSNGKQEYYKMTNGNYVGTGVYEPLPPAP